MVSMVVAVVEDDAVDNASVVAVMLLCTKLDVFFVSAAAVLPPRTSTDEVFFEENAELACRGKRAPEDLDVVAKE
jgi:hypothetical protein